MIQRLFCIEELQFKYIIDIYMSQEQLDMFRFRYASNEMIIQYAVCSWIT